jgi:uncharacterized protein YdeI (YjbR/CyaY-like superfamily)
MAKRKKVQTIKVPDYGFDELNRLAVAQHAFERMTADERRAALHWFKGKYAAEWPSDHY